MSERLERREQSAWNRYLPPSIALILAVALGTVILNVNTGNVSEASAKVVQSLIWPAFAIILVLFFRVQAESLFDTLLRKVELAEKVSAGGVIIESGPRHIPVPKSGEPVTLENVALMHTSFIRPDKTKQFNDGVSYYQIEVIVLAPQPTLDRITSVTYRLDPAYQKNVYEVMDRQSRFKLKELANGTSIVRAEIKFREQDELLYLNRFIDLRSDGPRL